MVEECYDDVFCLEATVWSLVGLGFLGLYAWIRCCSLICLNQREINVDDNMIF